MGTVPAAWLSCPAQMSSVLGRDPSALSCWDEGVPKAFSCSASPGPAGSSFKPLCRESPSISFLVPVRASFDPSLHTKISQGVELLRIIPALMPSAGL